MNTTLTLVTLFACGVTLATCWVYERALREARFQIELARDHADVCQSLMLAMREHPSGKRISPDLTLITGGNDAS